MSTEGIVIIIVAIVMSILILAALCIACFERR